MLKGIDAFWLPKYADRNSLTHVFPLFGYEDSQIIININKLNKINKM